MTNAHSMLVEIATRVPQLSPHEARLRMAQGALLLDVREDTEHAAGMPLGAIGVARSHLEFTIEQVAPQRDRELLTICAAGVRSLLVADTLQKMGYLHVASVSGGYARWRAEGHPLARPSSLDNDALERYSRHLLLPEVGEVGQARLASAQVALVGAGGLGSPAAFYLAAAGVGTLTLIDDDRVERSNLQRQILHADARVGMFKTDSAKIALNALNPRIHINTYTERLRATNVESLLTGHDVIIDGADNFPTRYLLNAACRRLGIPLIYGAVHRFTGQVSVFDPRHAESPCYQCLFPESPAAEDAPNCAEAGVLGVLPGIIGLLQASEALKCLLEIGTSLMARLLCFDALTMRFHELRLRRDVNCPGCGAAAEFSGYEDSEPLCRGS